MIEGVVLFFSPRGDIAHIWCGLSEVPLCVAYREDFPALWHRLQVGSRVQLKASREDALMRAHELKLFSMERVESS